MPYCARGAGRDAARAPDAQQVGGGVGLAAVGGLALLEALEHLGHHDARRDLCRAQRDVEILGLAEAHLTDHVGEQRRAGDLLGRQALALELLLQQVAAGVLGVLARLGLEPLLDLVARTSGLDHRQPVARRAALTLAGEDLDDVTGLQLVVQRHDLAVHARAHAAVPDLRVHLVGEVQRRGAGRERLHLALRGEDVHLVLEQVDLQRLHELVRIGQVLLPVEHRAQPLQLGVVVEAGLAAATGLTHARLLVHPVSGDAQLGHLVHLVGADLDLQRPPLGSDHRRVQRLVHVELGHRDEVLEAARQGLPQRVHHADGAVAVLHRIGDDAHRREVVDLVELAALLGHLRVDRIEVLRAAGDVSLDAKPLKLAGKVFAGLVDVALALLALLADQALDLLVLARVKRREGEVLQLPLDRVDAQAVGDRRVDLQRLFGLLDLLLLGQRVDRAHVVQAVGQLDQDDPHVDGHRDDHLAVVLGLRGVARLEGDAGQLGHAVDQRGDLLAETGLHLLQRRARVLDRVVQQRGAQRLGVKAHAGADARDADRMHDEVLARAPALVGVVLAGEHERVLHAVTVDRRRGLRLVLGDDREQVAEQAALELVEICQGHARRALGPPVGGTLAAASRARSGARAGRALGLLDARAAALASAGGRRDLGFARDGHRASYSVGESGVAGSTCGSRPGVAAAQAPPRRCAPRRKAARRGSRWRAPPPGATAGACGRSATLSSRAPAGRTAQRDGAPGRVEVDERRPRPARPAAGGGEPPPAHRARRPADRQSRRRERHAVAQAAVQHAQRRAQVVVALDHAQGEADLGLAPQQVHEAVAAAHQGVLRLAGRRVQHRDVRVASGEAGVPGERRERAQVKAAHAAREVLAPARRVRADHQQRLAGGDQAGERPRDPVPAAVAFGAPSAASAADRRGGGLAAGDRLGEPARSDTPP